jgi:hypothetical protein
MHVCSADVCSAYRHTSSTKTQRRGAVHHSGDVVDEAQRCGLHTISIDLAGLGDCVAEMFITMSSWAGARLSDIEQPFVKVSGRRAAGGGRRAAGGAAKLSWQAAAMALLRVRQHAAGNPSNPLAGCSGPCTRQGCAMHSCGRRGRWAGAAAFPPGQRMGPRQYTPC